MKMKKIAGVIMALPVAVLMMVGFSSPAQADAKTGCWYHDMGPFSPDVRVCSNAQYTDQQDGRGMSIQQINLSCGAASQFENDPAVNGRLLQVIHSNGEQVWARGDAYSNIGGNCYRSYDVDIRMPRATSFAITYNFRARLDLASDADGYIGFWSYNND